ncbi:LysR family transcriptional regulator [Yoonia sp. BS5-3]|uniref:LysR family transcriptional regulator n=1 Tax=Yoonia phaeophyticola TaxID=3137369 RepID=A0ABZ2V4B4_9RHOB
MNWRDIPSLAALRAFEVAARTGSYSAAAQELNVTHAAIAQHVRAVEAHLDTILMLRDGRAMKPTETGAALAAELSAGFRQIVEGVKAINEDVDARPLSVSVTPSFADNWLMPRLTRFWAEHPGFSLSVSPSMDLVDLRRDGFDMAIRYGRGDWPDVTATHLVAANYTVVAAPDLVKGRTIKALSDLYDLPWLFTSKDSEAQKWVTESGFDMACCQANTVATGSMLLAGARAGGGVAVIAGALIEDDLATGRLVALMRAQHEELGYYIIHRPGILSERAKILKSWLLKNAQG